MQTISTLTSSKIVLTNLNVIQGGTSGGKGIDHKSIYKSPSGGKNLD